MDTTKKLRWQDGKNIGVHQPRNKGKAGWQRLGRSNASLQKLAKGRLLSSHSFHGPKVAIGHETFSNDVSGLASFSTSHIEPMHRYSDSHLTNDMSATDEPRSSHVGIHCRFRRNQDATPQICAPRGHVLTGATHNNKQEDAHVSHARGTTAVRRRAEARHIVER